MNIQLPQSFYDSVLLSSFLEVKAPDINHIDAFWHDENDDPIDCNIYHPKYGNITIDNQYGSFDVRLGFLTDTKEHIISSCSYSYQSYDTNETVYCQFKPLPLLCINEDGTLTNKDGKIINKVDWLQTNRTRQALDRNDFAEIYQREFMRSELLDTPINHAVFKERLAVHVNDLIKLHQDNRIYGRTLDLPIIAKAKDFLTWMPGYTMPAILIDGILFNVQLVSSIHRHYNDVIFSNISETQLFEALNDPAQHGHLIKVKSGKQYACMGLIRYLTDKRDLHDWKDAMLVAVGFDKEVYRKKSKEYADKIKID